MVSPLASKATNRRGKDDMNDIDEKFPWTIDRRSELLKFLRSLRKCGLLTEVSELDKVHHVSSERPALIDCSIF